MALGPHLSPPLVFFFVNNVVLEQSCAHWFKGSSLVQADGGKREREQWKVSGNGLEKKATGFADRFDMEKGEGWQECFLTQHFTGSPGMATICRNQ